MLLVTIRQRIKLIDSDAPSYEGAKDWALKHFRSLEAALLPWPLIAQSLIFFVLALHILCYD